MLVKDLKIGQFACIFVSSKPQNIHPNFGLSWTADGQMYVHDFVQKVDSENVTTVSFIIPVSTIVRIKRN